ncbi:hypothetical protein DNX69_07075 [Rhodopseudomonas palustris]|uniref:PEGA domain-containing protein n=1 Tax=Rhodopseudomonas palustris TaxID=1076 RepID=A0A323UJH8_RHOPL|nr:hypothetical protein [Rhodopseudomonas palustris]PZA12654.1 hypothetical protein DNX69_07075 [Rhodopseudomonas palustris]
MRHLVVIALAGLSLGGCASMSDAFKSTPPDVTVQLDSVPPGADAVASTGQSCKTPCSVKVSPADFNVTFTMDKFQPVTIPVQVVVTPGSFMSEGTTTVTPNPVTAELQPAKPARRARHASKRKPKPAAAAPASEAPAAASPFPAPSGTR